jgi:hypothetical protein
MSLCDPPVTAKQLLTRLPASRPSHMLALRALRMPAYRIRAAHVSPVLHLSRSQTQHRPAPTRLAACAATPATWGASPAHPARGAGAAAPAAPSGSPRGRPGGATDKGGTPVANTAPCDGGWPRLPPRSASARYAPTHGYGRPWCCPCTGARAGGLPMMSAGAQAGAASSPP